MLPRKDGLRFADVLAGEFQSQTRRLLPRNATSIALVALSSYRFNRRRDACFPATAGRLYLYRRLYGFQSQTRRLLPRNLEKDGAAANCCPVSIADATLASPQRI